MIFRNRLGYRLQVSSTLILVALIPILASYWFFRVIYLSPVGFTFLIGLMVIIIGFIFGYIASLWLSKITITDSGIELFDLFRTHKIPWISIQRWTKFDYQLPIPMSRPGLEIIFTEDSKTKKVVWGIYNYEKIDKLIQQISHHVSNVKTEESSMVYGSPMIQAASGNKKAALMVAAAFGLLVSVKLFGVLLEFLKPIRSLGDLMLFLLAFLSGLFIAIGIIYRLFLSIQKSNKV